MCALLQDDEPEQRQPALRAVPRERVAVLERPPEQAAAADGDPAGGEAELGAAAQLQGRPLVEDVVVVHVQEQPRGGHQHVAQVPVAERDQVAGDGLQGEGDGEVVDLGGRRAAGGGGGREEGQQGGGGVTDLG